jgi:membrane protease YdiL (CAAX protease family)
MHFDLNTIKCYLIPSAIFFIAVLIATFAQQNRDWLLPVVFLLLPLFDIYWRVPQSRIAKWNIIHQLTLVVIIVILLVRNVEVIDVFVVMLLSAAIPEEWFFRGYLQKKYGNNFRAIFAVSFLFALMHYLVQESEVSLLSLLVFIPSVLFGLVYKITGDMIVVVMLHALSNLLYYLYFADYIKELLY